MHAVEIADGDDRATERVGRRTRRGNFSPALSFDG